MVSVDEHTRDAIEIVSQGVKLSEALILKTLQAVTNILTKGKTTVNNKIVNKDSILHSSDTPEGKVKVKNLIAKYKDGVMALDDNLTKEQVKDYKKEFKKLGVDFSIIKNDKDNYSFFFAAKDVGIIEKGLKNVLEKKNIENEQQENSNENTSLENEPSFIEINKSTPESHFEGIFSNLSKDEQKLFIQLNNSKVESLDNYFADRSSHVESKKLSKLEKDFSPEQIAKVEKLYKENISTAQYDKNTPDGMLHMDHVDTELKKYNSKNINKTEKAKGKQVLGNKPNFKEIDKDIAENHLEKITSNLSEKEKGLFIQLNNSKVESLDNYYADRISYVEHEKLAKLEKDFSPEQIAKVEKLYRKNVSNEEYPIHTPKGMLHMNTVKEILKKDPPEKAEKKENFYSMQNVKKLDKEIKAKDKEKQLDKDKNRKPSMER